MVYILDTTRYSIRTFNSKCLSSISDFCAVMIPKGGHCCGISLRPLCYIIAYSHLLSSLVDLLCHFVTVATATNWFQCDVNAEGLKAVSVPWLEPILIVINLGTHGFYPYPRVVRNQYPTYVEMMTVIGESRCYPGMLHIHLIDLLNFLINIIWLRIVISYVGAVHKKDPEPMRMFFSLSVVKLVMQAMYFGYQPAFYDIYSTETIWFLKLTDILVAIIFLVIVQRYSKFLRMENAANQNVEKPPAYIECLINSPIRPPAYEAKEEVIVVEEEKKH
ncbi:unnamed protein product [Arctia plantaginis]|uniref:Uncharacterized protein n=1 Tax=Arctia plantaginis TaxID=874455 RepID=A0A8S1A1E5_ARCPL|nr:unnamed protein product [Arctia plantaginis]